MNFPDIPQMLDKYMESQIKLWPATTNRASLIGDPCIRKLVYYRLYPELQELHNLDLQYIFNEGSKQEKAFITDLREAGINFVEEQRGFKDDRYNLTGSIDGKIIYEGYSFPTEIKSMNPHIWDNVNELKDFDKYPWTKKYPGQLQAYMFLDNKEYGIMLLKNKSTGKPKMITFELDYDYCESLLNKCDQINLFVVGKELPERTLSEDCKVCPFFSSCCPPEEFTPIDFIDEPKLAEDIETWMSLKDYSSLYTKLDKNIKGQLRGIEKTVIGDYIIQGKETKNGWQVDIKRIKMNE